MKSLKSILVIGVILLTIKETHAQDQYSNAPSKDTLYDAYSKIIVVPEGKGEHVVTDGYFSVGEWEDALRYSVADNYDIYLKADSEFLYIGLKSAKPIGELVCESRITSDEKKAFLLHVSGALGEGISGFPATTKFDLNNNQLWKANILKADSLKNEAWIAAGRPIEKYDDVYNKRDGIEFKIHRKKIMANSLKFMIGWIRVEVQGKNINKKVYNYPMSASLKNSDNWVKLILPAIKS
jgi:hypothetical protein